MAFEHNGKRFTEPQDLKVKLLNFLPSVPIYDPALKQELGRDFLGPDEVVALIQVAVARAVDYQTGLEQELLKMQAEGKKIADAIFKKNLSGIGRGHSLDGLPVVALGINGTKMIDSAFTGMVYARSLVTSGRRRETTLSELVVPRAISASPQLLAEYLTIAEDLFALSEEIRRNYAKKVDAIQAFNKLKPYNDPGDLFYVLPLSSLVNLAMQVDEEHRNASTWLPEEFELFTQIMEGLVDQAGMGQIFRMRKAVPRETYQHYQIFKAPGPDYVSSRHAERNYPIDPAVVRLINDLPQQGKAELATLAEMFADTRSYHDATHLYDLTRRNLAALSSFCRRYNAALNIQTISSLSWRVWSEQKRHGTLGQHVESIYTAAGRAYEIVREIWPKLQNRHCEDELVERAEQAFVISDGIKAEPGMCAAYVFHSCRQIMFYGRLIEAGLKPRDALYTVPRNIRVRTLENYDLINAVSLELPLRLCTECEPERRITSEHKAVLFKEALPELAFLFEPKCNLGYCTEGKFCAKIMHLNKAYNLETHKAVADIIAADH